MVRVGSIALRANGLSFVLFGFYTVYSFLFLVMGKATEGCILGACRQCDRSHCGQCGTSVILGSTVYHADGKTGQKLENQRGNTDFQNFGHNLFCKATFFNTKAEHALFVQPIAGFSYGAKKFDRLREAIKTAILCSTAFCVIFGVIAAVSPGMEWKYGLLLSAILCVAEPP